MTMKEKAALLESEDKYRSIFEAAQDAIIILKHQTGQILDVNRSACELYGYSREELLELCNIDLSAEPERTVSGLEAGETRIPIRYHRKKNGTVFPVEISVSYYSHKGRRVSTSVIRDISDRKRAEDALRESERRYRTMVETQVEAVCRWLPDTTLTYVNQVYCRFYGKKSEELLGRKWLSLTPEKFRTPLQEYCRLLASNPKVHAYEHKMVGSDGNLYWRHWIECPIFDDDGNLVEFQSVGRDITDIKRTEQALRESELRFRQLVENVREVFWIEEVSTERFIYISPNYEALWCKSRESLYHDSASILDSVHAEDRERVKRAIETRRQTFEYDIEYRIMQPDGCVRWVRSRSLPVRDEGGKVYRFAGIAEDVTEYKSAVETIEKSEEALRSIVNSVYDAIIVHDFHGKILDVNDKMIEMFGVSREEAKEHSFFQDYNGKPDSVEELRDIFENVSRGTNAFFEWTARRPGDGSVFHVEIFLRKLFLHEKDVILASLRDISARKRYEEERIRLIMAIEQADEGIVVSDANGLIQYANPAFEKMSGFSLPELRENRINILEAGNPGENRGGSPKDAMWDTLRSKKVWSGKLAKEKKNGRYYEVETTVSPVVDKEGNIISYVLVERDITYESDLERQLRHSQKQEAIGTLAGGIAHDLNNNLLPIIINTEFVLGKLPEESPLREHLDDALQSARKARDLVKQIQEFSRQSEHRQIPLQISPLIKETIKILKATLPKTIDLRTDLRTSCDTVMADPTQLHRVILNLCTNAAHAIGVSSGVLEVKLREAFLTSPRGPHASHLSPGRYLVLSVKDTGCGIAEENLDRVFEPFFTTKRTGEGTGMGLAVVHGVVTAHGGTVQASSIPGRGSLFEVYLPLMEGAPEEEKKRQEGEWAGEGRILLVEDEEGVLRSMQKALERAGYEVVVGRSGSDALRVFEKNPNFFDLCITDQSMPQMSGMELAVELLKLRNNLPVILCTGYAAEDMLEKMKEAGIADLLTKPCNHQDLLEFVHKVLEKSCGGADRTAGTQRMPRQDED